MALRVGINGFGRIGRLVLRAALDVPGLDCIAVNDVADTETLAYLLQFDTVHGLLDGDVELIPDGLSIDGRDLRCLREADPARLPWGDLGVELVIEATGRFTNRAAVEAHLHAGAKRVIVTAPARDMDGTFVIGVNDDTLDPERHVIISSASCTTNTLALLAKILYEHFGIERGIMTTMHAYTNSQALLDRPMGTLRRSRAAAVNLVPTSTGAARTIDEVIPELTGRIEALAIRSPHPAGSILDFTVQLANTVDAQTLNDVLLQESETARYQELLLVSHDPLVSTDIVGTSFSAIVDAESTLVNGNLAKVLAWYDNEWGYSCRVVDLALMLAEPEA
jgi:glyceraldehyde 3-phosphate dehydrogenase